MAASIWCVHAQLNINRGRQRRDVGAGIVAPMSVVDRSAARVSTARVFSKVPEVTVLFWVIKVLTTGMGETTSDYLAKTYDPVLAVGAVGVVFVLSLTVQLLARRYVAAVYWF